MRKYTGIHIFLRDTTRNRFQALRPDFFNYEKAFLNLLKSTNWENCCLTVVLDGKYEESHISKYIPKDRVFEIDTRPELKPDRDGSNLSQVKTVEIIKKTNIEDNFIIAIVENDYLYRKDYDKVIIEAFNCIDDEYYLSGYDHMDKYLCCDESRTDEFSMYAGLKSKIFLTPYCHFREVPNITSSYFITPKNFERDFDLFVQGLADNYTCHLLSQRGRKFASPIPSLMTHTQNPWLAPYFNWSDIQNA